MTINWQFQWKSWAISLWVIGQVYPRDLPTILAIVIGFGYSLWLYGKTPLPMTPHALVRGDEKFNLKLTTKLLFYKLSSTVFEGVLQPAVLETDINFFPRTPSCLQQYQHIMTDVLTNAILAWLLT